MSELGPIGSAGEDSIPDFCFDFTFQPIWEESREEWRKGRKKGRNSSSFFLRNSRGKEKRKIFRISFLPLSQSRRKIARRDDGEGSENKKKEIKSLKAQQGVEAILGRGCSGGTDLHFFLFFYFAPEYKGGCRFRPTSGFVSRRPESGTSAHEKSGRGSCRDRIPPIPRFHFRKG